MPIKITKEQAKKMGIKLQPFAKNPSENTNNGRFHEDNLKEVTVNSISMVIPIKSKPKHRPRTFIDEKSIFNAYNTAKSFKQFMSMIKTKTITTKETRDFETAVANMARVKMGNRDPFDVPIMLEIVFFLPGKEGEIPTSIRDGDLDNHEKSVCDALNNVLYTDDRLIVKKITEKRCYSGKGEIHIKASPL